jgi:hypothetical protein
MNTYPIAQESKDKELQTISIILTNNHYSQQEMQQKRKQTSNTKETQELRWATFTYYGNDTRIITKLLKNTNIKIAYKTNTTENHLKPKKPVIDIYNQSGIYQLKCNDCPLKYIGQRRIFRVRYNEYIHAVKTNKQNSKYAQHILNTGHTYSTINETLEILHTEKKGQLLNTLERYHVYDLSIHKKQMDDTFANKHNSDLSFYLPATLFKMY